MGPRILENGNLQSKEVEDIDGADIINSLLHIKHRFIKLVDGQLHRIKTQGITCEGICGDAVSEAKAPDLAIEIPGGSPIRRAKRALTFENGIPGGSEGIKNDKPNDTSNNISTSSGNNRSGNPTHISGKLQSVFEVLLSILAVLVLLLIIVWTSAGPLSNKVPHTPTSLWSSLLRTDGPCALEKKNDFRWS